MKRKEVFGDAKIPPKTQRKKQDQVSSKSPNPPSQMSTNKQREIIRAIKQKNSAIRSKKQDLLKAAISTLDDEEEEDFYRHHSRSPQSQNSLYYPSVTPIKDRKSTLGGHHSR